MTTVSISGTLTVNPSLSVTLTINPIIITLGQSVNLTASVTGGTGPYTYTWSNLPSPCSGTSNTITCTPNTTGTFNISVQVKDSSGLTANATGTLTVSPSPTALAVTLSITPNTIDIGQSLTLTATATGGIIPYNYTWAGLPTGCTGGNSNKLTCTPSATGTFNVMVSVTDSSITNLVQNPGFEIASTSNQNMPANWWTFFSAGTPTFSYPEPGRTGGSSIAISYSTLVTGSALIGQNIPLKGLDMTKQYILSGWIETQGINGTGAFFQIDWYGNNNTTYISSLTTSNFTGTTWTQFTKSGIAIPSNADTARVLCKLSNCTGKAWFDDISFG